MQIGEPGGGQRNQPPFNPMELFRLANALRDDAEDGEWVTARILESTAEFEEVPLKACYAALPLAHDLSLRTEHDVALDVCLAGCQAKGAVGLLDGLLILRSERESQGKPSFDIVPRGCLDDCDHGPIIRSRSPSGTFLHPQASSSQVAEIVETLCD